MRTAPKPPRQTSMSVASKAFGKEPQRTSSYGLVSSIVTFAVMLLLVVLLFEYTNIFNEWLSWAVVPAVVALVGYDVYLRCRRVGRED